MEDGLSSLSLTWCCSDDCGISLSSVNGDIWKGRELGLRIRECFPFAGFLSSVDDHEARCTDVMSQLRLSASSTMDEIFRKEEWI
jgi:hypothetical protein